MSDLAAAVDAAPPLSGARRLAIILLLGFTTIFVYGGSYFSPTVLAPAIVAETGWPLPWVVGGLSLSLLVCGLSVPFAGRRIERLGGRGVLPFGALAMAAGLALLGLSHSLWLYGGAWLLMGLGASGVYYDATFATLGRQFGQRARTMITLLTLVGGFTSTLSWPFTALLQDWFGWRGAYFAYAGLVLALALPLRLLLPVPPAHRPRPPLAAGTVEPPRASLPLLIVLGLCLSLASVITTVLALHLVPILGARGIDLAGAVALGTVIGPCQVGSRVVELLLGRRVHPLWTLLVSTTATAIGMTLLALGWGWIALALMIYGVGLGIRTVAGGTVPLALVGQRGYATVMGRLALPNQAAQALAPVAAAALLELHPDAGGWLAWILAGIALVNLGLSLWLLAAGRKIRAD